MREITVYGMDECEDTQSTLQFLKRHSVPYQYHKIDMDREAYLLVQDWYPGGIKTPVVVIEQSGVRLVEPTDELLRTTLKSGGILHEAA